MRRMLIAAATLSLLGGGVRAQGPRGADTLSAKSVADSLAVLRTLEGKTQANANDAAAWYQQGMIAWALADRSRAPNPPSGLDGTRLYRNADNALRMAASTAPKNAYYKVAVGKFLLTSGNTITRTAATSQFSGAIEAARANRDSVAIGESAVEYGRIFWRRYDALANRRLSTSGIDVGRSISDAMQPVAKVAEAMAQQVDIAGYDMMLPQTSMKEVRTLINNTTMALPSDVNGAADYERASELFREAYAAAPTNPRTFRSVAMVFADSSRWRELESFAQTHLRALPWDPAGWMALGLALHRLGKSDVAASAFDSAMVYLSPEDRGRLDRLERVLRPTDTARVARGSAGDRAALTRMYWLFADPLWSKEGNESRIEFLARVEFAELRWTVDELGYRGADTDRGDVHIRYGPPDVIAAVAPGVNVETGDIVTFWLYKSGLMFAFTGMATYGSARTPMGDVAMVDAIKIARPVGWENIASVVHVDSMPVQVTRFRAARDSVDVLFAARPNVAAIVKESQVAEPVRNNFWLLLGGTVAVYFDSSQVDESEMKTWTRRLPPGNFVYRIEASARSSNRAGRATSQVVTATDPRTGFSAQGFGLSDVLLATSSRQATSPAARWSSFEPVPLVGSIAHGAQLSVVWENYDFGQRSGSAEYTVALTMVRDRSGAGRIAARIVGALASVAQVSQQDDKVTVKFDRAVPYAPAFADQIDIALGDTPAGSYTLTLEVTDKGSGKKATRTMGVFVRGQ